MILNSNYKRGGSLYKNVASLRELGISSSQPLPHQISNLLHPQKPPISFVYNSDSTSTFHSFKYPKRQTQSAMKEFTIPEKSSDFLQVDRIYSALDGEAQRPLAEFQEDFYKLKRRTIGRKTVGCKRLVVQRVNALVEWLEFEKQDAQLSCGGKSESDDLGNEID